ncbi:DUF2490 domain-containing protein [Allomuricauda sp. d1]|uniref:DUF2490 domain-containing protein n=1 Tax=Allomuricauda sp. d1 TaxID=3136725 RepID=UPI0031DBE1FB
MSYIKRVYLLILFLVALSLHAQENFTSYLQPQVAINYKVSSFYTHNFSLENRNYTIESGESRFRVRHLHLAHFSNLKIKDNQSIALGIQYRFRQAFDDGSNELRLTQQYNLTKQALVTRFGHRLRTEQRITKNLTTHRFRYRFSMDFPLRGERLDVGEPYLVGNWESLLSVAKTKLPEYDQRFTLNLGWLLTKKTKFQVGAEYRFEDFTHQTQHVLFLLTTFNISL